MKRIRFFKVGLLLCFAFLFTFLYGLEPTSPIFTNSGVETNTNYLQVASQLGIEPIKAAKIVNAIDAGSTVYSVIALCLALTGADLVTAGAIFAVKSIIKRCGKTAAISY